MSEALVALVEGVGEAFVAFEDVLNALVALAVLGGEVFLFLALGSFVAFVETDAASLVALADEVFSAFASAVLDDLVLLAFDALAVATESIRSPLNC